VAESGRLASQIARCWALGDSIGRAGLGSERARRGCRGRPGVAAETRWPENPEAALTIEATLAQEKDGSVVEGRGGVGGERGLVVTSTFVAVVTFVDVG